MGLIGFVQHMNHIPAAQRLTPPHSITLEPLDPRGAIPGCSVSSVSDPPHVSMVPPAPVLAMCNQLVNVSSVNRYGSEIVRRMRDVPASLEAYTNTEKSVCSSSCKSASTARRILKWRYGSMRQQQRKLRCHS